MVPIAHGGSAFVGISDVTCATLRHRRPYFSVSGRTSDTFVLVQDNEPIGLYCSDETDGESLRACGPVIEGSTPHADGGRSSNLATECVPNEDGPCGRSSSVRG